MQARVVVVTLDIDTDIDKHDAYLNSSALKKLKALIKRIQEICSELEKREPAAKWLIVWREHGVEDNHKKYFWKREKKLFKEKLQALTLKYSQLCIIAGTILTARRFTLKSNERKYKLNNKLSAIGEAYAAHDWIIEKEITHGERKEYQGHYQLFQTKQQLKEGKSRVLVRNTAYIFLKGECVGRHDKIAPFLELGKRPGTNEIFQIGKGRNQKAYHTITFADGFSLPIGIEICREHFAGVLKRECEALKRQPPVVHFVLSNSITRCIDNIYGDYFVHVDKNNAPVLEATHSLSGAPVKIVHYKNIFLTDVCQLEGPIAPVEPAKKGFLKYFLGYFD